uniref:Uncharacterized protein n=1 Tax=Leersia perrieri TaxID=77586 RepID=A0A0D9XUB9_9ORYZ
MTLQGNNFSWLLPFSDGGLRQRRGQGDLFRGPGPAHLRLFQEGINLCAFYVAESIMSRGQRTYSALSDLEYTRDRVAQEGKHKAIQEAFAGFLNDEVLDPKGEHYYDGRLEPASVDYNIDLDDPN